VMLSRSAGKVRGTLIATWVVASLAGTERACTVHRTSVSDTSLTRCYFRLLTANDVADVFRSSADVSVMRPIPTWHIFTSVSCRARPYYIPIVYQPPIFTSRCTFPVHSAVWIFFAYWTAKNDKYTLLLNNRHV